MADLAIVWAQLHVGARCHGVHAFVVPLCDTQTKRPYPGVHRGDIGPKMGANAMDNGYLCLNQVRIPRKYMLDRFSHVTRDGHFHCELRPNARFAESMGQFIMGRIAMAASALTNAQLAMVTAVRYSCVRHAFGRPVIDYATHATQLVKLLSQHMVYTCLKSKVVKLHQRSVKPLHALSCIIKALFTEHAVQALTIGRRLMGGHGYSACNRLGPLRDAQVSGE